MAALAEQQRERADFRHDALSREVGENHETIFLRRKVDTLLDLIERQKLSTQNSVQKYRAFLQTDQDTESLTKLYEWMLDREQSAMNRLNQIQARIDEGIRRGIIGENDREFLMRRLIFTGKEGEDFIGKADEIERIFNEKFDHLERDRKEYDLLRNHPLVRNTGFLKTAPDTKMEVPDERKFLAMAVPERRKLLEEAKKALPEAQRYAKKTGTAESGKLEKDYEALLKSAWQNPDPKKRIIGRKTYEKFKDGFSKLDLKDRQYWISQFKNEMQRYETVWKDIRGTLKGEDLAYMEGKRDTMGWSGLSGEFAKTIEKGYDRSLEKFYGDKLISRHTKKAFSDDMRRQSSLPEKQRYLKYLDDQMDRYRTLRQKIDGLKDKKAQAELNGMYERKDCGYKEINGRYQELADPDRSKAGQKEGISGAMDTLSEVRRDRVRHNIIWSEGLLKNKDEKERMVHRLDQMLETRQQTDYDQSDYAASVKQARWARYQKKKPAESPQDPVALKPETEADDHEQKKSGKSLMGRMWGAIWRKKAGSAIGRQEQSTASSGSPKKTDQTVAESREEAHQLEKEAGQGVKVTSSAVDAFNMTEISDPKQTKKVLRFGIGDRAAVESFLHEDLQLKGGRDEMHLMAKESDKIERLTFQEIRAYRNYLRESLRQ